MSDELKKVIQSLDGVACANIAEPSPGDLERVLKQNCALTSELASVRGERDEAWANSDAFALQAGLAEASAETFKRERDALKAEVERLEGLVTFWSDKVELFNIEKLSRERDALKESLKECFKALRWLLNDTQHTDHSCGDKQCPVDNAKEARNKLLEAHPWIDEKEET